jgi:DNA-binding YbaB/EbfC family protein
MFDWMSNLQGMMKQAQEMRGKIKEIQSALAKTTVEAGSGGGMVTVVMNGRFEIVSIRIDPEAVKPDEVKTLQNLIVSAVNAAQRKAQEAAAEKMKELTGGLPIPGLFQ